MAVLAHLSDLHLDGGPRAAERAERVLSFLDGLREPVDAVLVTGDLTDHGTHVLDGDGRLTTHVRPVPREA